VFGTTDRALTRGLFIKTRLFGRYNGLSSEKTGLGRRFKNKEEIMKCMHCQRTMAKGTAPFHIDKKGYHFTLDEVPTWVCQQCGEVYFDIA
jgi:YgiT-type zinc finger domain-containing protein